MPLMIRMLDGLELFVELDVPFLKAERLERCARLRALMERADVTVAEKFGSRSPAEEILTLTAASSDLSVQAPAVRIVSSGDTIEIYKDTLAINGATLEVNVLRLGRIGLYYQTNDASATGLWDPDTQEWTPLTGDGARNQVRQGLRIARKQIAPDLLLLDISAPEVSP